MIMVFQTIEHDSYAIYTFSIVTEDNHTFLGTKMINGRVQGWHAAYRGTTVDPTGERLIYSSP